MHVHVHVHVHVQYINTDCIYMYMYSPLFLFQIPTGKSETYCDMLRSILAQLDYSYQINHWNSVGVPFKDHLHVPEVHPLTGVLFCEREDEGHVFKVVIAIIFCIIFILFGLL